jgi:hypothetical protein
MAGPVRTTLPLVAVEISPATTLPLAEQEMLCDAQPESVHQRRNAVNSFMFIT